MTSSGAIGSFSVLAAHRELGVLVTISGCSPCSSLRQGNFPLATKCVSSHFLQHRVISDFVSVVLMVTDVRNGVPFVGEEGLLLSLFLPRQVLATNQGPYGMASSSPSCQGPARLCMDDAEWRRSLGWLKPANGFDALWADNVICSHSL